MPESAALESARALLAYWEKEDEKALGAKDPKQIARCDGFMQQCKRMIASLEHAAKSRK
jgi:hypothetical protein